MLPRLLHTAYIARYELALLKFDFEKTAVKQLISEFAKYFTATFVQIERGRKTERMYKDVERTVVVKRWFTEIRKNGTQVNGALICRKVEDLAKHMGKTTL